MQAIWYGDRRDRVKWGALLYLAKRHGIRQIIQVAYFRGSDGQNASRRSFGNLASNRRPCLESPLEPPQY